MPLGHAIRLLNDVTSHVLHAAVPRPGEQIPLRGGPVIETVEVVEPTVHLMTVIGLYGPGMWALQLVHTDNRSHWPWEVGTPVSGAFSRSLGMRASPVGAA